MATPLGWSQGGSGSVCLAFDQLRDVIESQEELIHQLRNVVRKVEGEAALEATCWRRSQTVPGALGQSGPEQGAEPRSARCAAATGRRS